MIGISTATGMIKDYDPLDIIASLIQDNQAEGYVYLSRSAFNDLKIMVQHQQRYFGLEIIQGVEMPTFQGVGLRVLDKQAYDEQNRARREQDQYEHSIAEFDKYMDEVQYAKNNTDRGAR